MDADIWLPLATFVLGLAGAQVTEMFRDRRTSDRERQAHDRERQVRQGEVQRATLLDLQDTLLELENLKNEVIDIALTPLPEKTQERRPEGPLAEPSAREREARTRLGAAEAKARLLTSRVLDTEARLAVVLYVATAHVAASPEGFPAIEEAKKVAERYNAAIERLGVLLRERY